MISDTRSVKGSNSIGFVNILIYNYRRLPLLWAYHLHCMLVWELFWFHGILLSCESLGLFVIIITHMDSIYEIAICYIRCIKKSRCSLKWTPIESMYRCWISAFIIIIFFSWSASLFSNFLCFRWSLNIGNR